MSGSVRCSLYPSKQVSDLGNTSVDPCSAPLTPTARRRSVRTIRSSDHLASSTRRSDPKSVCSI
jgi:hypothetical protein